MLDNLMVGQIGTNEMSGVSIANQLVFVFNLTIFGAIAGVGIFGAQFFGKGDYEGIRYVIRFKMLTALSVLILGIVLIKLFGTQIISLYLHEGGEIGNIDLNLKYAKEYINIILLSFVPMTISTVYASTLRECGKTVPPMIASIV